MALEGIEGVIKGLESQASWQVQQQFRLVLVHWPKAVGFAVARKTRPISVQRGTLYVATASASWAQTLSYERLNILRKLNRHQRQPLKSIRFSTAQWSQAPAAASAIASEREAALTRAQKHPSYVGDVPTLPVQGDPTPQTAFRQWSTAIQTLQHTQSICPICRCHCPQGELERWARCGHCATKIWQSFDSGQGRSDT